MKSAMRNMLISLGMVCVIGLILFWLAPGRFGQAAAAMGNSIECIQEGGISFNAPPRPWMYVVTHSGQAFLVVSTIHGVAIERLYAD